MTGAIIQARMSSSRLPGKVLLPLGDRTALEQVVRRVRDAASVDEVVVATSTDASDDPVADLCARSDIRSVRGPLEDVLARYSLAAEALDADIVVRITGDCPLIDPVLVDACIARLHDGYFDYASNCTNGPRTFPRGLDVEVFTRAALRRASAEATSARDREHVTPYIWEHGDMFKVAPALEAAPSYARAYRLTLDYPEDYELLKTLYDRGETELPGALSYLDAHPELVALNASREADHQARLATS